MIFSKTKAIVATVSQCIFILATVGAVTVFASVVYGQTVGKASQEQDGDTADRVQQAVFVKRLEELSPTVKGADNDELGRLLGQIAKASAGPERALAYYQAASYSKDLDLFFRFRAIEEEVMNIIVENDKEHGFTPPFFIDSNVDLTLTAARHHGYPNAYLTSILVEELQGKPLRSELLEDAFATAGREEVGSICELIDRRKSDLSSQEVREVQGLYYAQCDDGSEGVRAGWLSSDGENIVVIPTDTERVSRAVKLHGKVKYKEALKELMVVVAHQAESKDADTGLMCRTRYWVARTQYRLRQRDEAMKNYDQVVKDCAQFPDLRVKSLYALGVRSYDKGNYDASRRYFLKLLDEYGERSHADDAVLYLARIDRKDDRLKGLQWVKLAVEKYPHGDMLFEIIWEHLEDLYRSQKYEQFMEELAGFKLPEHDNNYYSQGRLEYYTARSLEGLGKKVEAGKIYKNLLVRYPFSFYGYLALKELQGSEGFSFEQALPADWAVPSWLGKAFASSTTFALLNAGLFQDAAKYVESLPSGLPKLEWQRALVLGLAGDYEASHNVVRRKITGRPWVRDVGREAPDVRPTLSVDQVLLSWPAPFRSFYLESAWLENEQAKVKNAAAPEVKPELAFAISREESGFNPKIVSYAGAVGLMQLMPATAKSHDDDIEGEATVEKLKTPEVNIRVGIDHLHWLAKRFDGNPILMIAAYNAGAGAVGKWLKRRSKEPIDLFVEDIPYDQTRNYTKRVFGSYLAYQYLNQVLNSGCANNEKSSTKTHKCNERPLMFDFRF